MTNQEKENSGTDNNELPGTEIENMDSGIDNDGSEQDELFEHHRFDVEKGHMMLRIDKFLINRMANVSRNKIQHACEAGNILVNGKVVKSSYKVKPLDQIQIVLPEPVRIHELIPQDLPINITYEDDEFVIINKNPGMVLFCRSFLIKPLRFRYLATPATPSLV